MRKIIYLFLGVFVLTTVLSCDNELLEEVVPEELTEAEIISGLKEALNVGIQNGADKANLLDGYFKNALIKILFPPEAIAVKNAVNDIYPQMVTDLELSLNRAAESAAKKSKPIFFSAITSMTIQDAKNILNGGDSLAATSYLKKSTSDTLQYLYKPDIKKALDSVSATKYWSDIITVYNGLTGESVNTDLPEYTTLKALDGLFYLVGQEEIKIRKDPVARISDILKKVFGSLDK
ncbi:MAG: hypothetical protein A3G23_09010 [Bacteroidetes bacterium RIFCSPLOWO2_12_FULL_37_12]|nr:MAG: hypothetical protein A3G23_09010 [Bacteroidetes bacterium RIFCSPLOWO2_12_FULL_37_12]